MNYAEELAYWYLRLNGFFPITNFVIHRSSEVDYPSDCDVIAVRPPHVFEEIGGQSEDWCEILFSNIPLSKTLGCICEVKTGTYDSENILRPKYVKQCISRLGLSSKLNVESISNHLANNIFWSEGETYIFKLLIANEEKPGTTSMFLLINEVEKFIETRINKYQTQKYQDRMLFSSDLFQFLIHQNSDS